jgi:hypothetical protein
MTFFVGFGVVSLIFAIFRFVQGMTSKDVSRRESLFQFSAIEGLLASIAFFIALCMAASA